MIICSSFCLAQKSDKGDVILSFYTPYSDIPGLEFNPRGFVIVGNDTIADNGSHLFRKLPVGLVKVYAECNGFIPVADSVVVVADKTSEVVISFEDRIVDLKMVVVNGKSPALIIRNDTIRFSPDGMNFAEEDKAREVLRRMPGVEFSNGSIKIGGETVMKTYVDGRTSLFGDNPMEAIDHIKADDVVHIYAYDEDEHPEESNPNRRGRKQRVINIETKSRMIDSYDGALFAGLGRTLGDNLEGHDSRYVGGGAFNMYSEKWMLKTDVLDNNQNSNSTNPNTYLTTQQPGDKYITNRLADASVERKWIGTGDEAGYDSKLSFDYRIGRTETESKDYSVTDYLPSGSYGRRRYSAGRFSDDDLLSKSAKLLADWNSKSAGRLTASYQFNKSNGSSSDEEENVDDVDNVQNIMRLRHEANSDNIGHTAQISYQRNLGRHFSLIADTRVKALQSSSASLRSVFTERTERGLDIPENDKGTVASTSVTLQYDTLSYTTDDKGNKRGSMLNSYTLGIEIGWDGSTYDKIATDIATGQTDLINTYSFRNRMRNDKLSIGYMRNTSACMLMSTFAIRKATILDRRKDQLSDDYSKSFYIPEASVIFQQPGLSGWGARYVLEGNVPDMMQLREVLDDRDPMFVRAGNSLLKQELTHIAVVNYRRYSGGFTGNWWEFSTIAHLTDNKIIPKTEFFAVDSNIDPYGYMMPAGSSLCSFTNAGGYRSLRVSVDDNLSLPDINGSCKVGIDYNRIRSPYYFNSLDIIDADRMSLKASVLSDIISHTHIEVDWNGSYNVGRYRSGADPTRLYSSNLSVKVNVNNIGKRGFFQARYLNMRNRNLVQHTRITDSMFNVYAGYRLKKNFEISLTAYDIFASQSSHSQTATENYTRLTFNENYGRYFSFNLKKTFNRVSSSRDAEGFNYGQFFKNIDK